MNYLKYIASAIIILLSITANAQEQPTFKNEQAYLQNPRAYLSDLDTAQMQTDILLDRVNNIELIENNNGLQSVTINSPLFNQMYHKVRFSANDPESYDSYKRADITVIKTEENVIPIGIAFFDYDIVDRKLVGDFGVAKSDKLQLSINGTSPFTTSRTFFASTLSQNFYGDKVQFIIPSQYFYSNVSSPNNIKSLEVDFGDDEGFVQARFDQIIPVNYSSRSMDHELVVKITTKQGNKLISHSTFSRVGSSTVPLPDKIFPENASVRDWTTDFNTGLYPTGCSGSACIEYHVLYSNNQTSGKLRRPLIVTDGFDPGNKRNYFENDVEDDPGLKYTADKRGLYQIVNGDKTAWENESSAGFVAKLRADGHDIVFVNFMDGADDIVTNGLIFRDFLNNVINGTLRDEKTEENIIVGPSMGGLVTRYALANIENTGGNHFTKTWFAFDSPMEGAYIPLTLQHAVKFAGDINNQWVIADLQTLENRMEQSEVDLNSDAAKQLLNYHYTATTDQGNPHSMNTSFFNTMDNVGYPDELKRYAISNGGSSTLYSGDNIRVLDFHLFTWFYMLGNNHNNSNSSTYYHELNNFSKQGFTNDVQFDTRYQFGYENAPGGYNTSLGAINGQDGHNRTKTWNSSSDVHFFKACFIPSSSALGIPLSTSTIRKSWSYLENNYSSPFDVIHGMTDNEEHVNISQATADKVNDVFLRIDFNEGEIPFDRGSSMTKVYDGPVSFNYKENLTFGKDNHEVVFEDDAHFIARAADYIRIESGVHIKTGAKAKFITEPVNYSSVFRSNSYATEEVDPTLPNNYLYEWNNYGQELDERDFVNVDKIEIYPNPSTVYINIQLRDQLINGKISIRSLNNQVVKSLNVSNKYAQKIFVGDLIAGNYFVDYTTENGAVEGIGKFIKLKQ